MLLSQHLPIHLKTGSFCPHYNQCGGCEIQEWPYQAQAEAKDRYLRLLFEEIFPPANWKTFLSSSKDDSVYYRNKIRFGFTDIQGIIYPSRHQKGREGADIAIRECYLHSPESNATIWAVADFANSHGWKVFDPSSNKGWLKHLIVRQGKFTGEFLVSLVTSNQPIREAELWLDNLSRQFPQIVSFYQTLTQGRNNERSIDRHLRGRKFITEKIGDFTFAISPHAFFQTNSLMVEKLYTTIRETAEIQTGETVWDLYAGSATIGIFLSRYCAKVLSIENNPQNILDAQLNLKNNRVENLDLHKGTVEDVLSNRFIQSRTKPNVIIVDPPRAGLSHALINLLPNLPAHRLVYVSCNPLTCLRDCQILAKQGYALHSLRGIDMFPHTGHCEMIAHLTLS